MRPQVYVYRGGSRDGDLLELDERLPTLVEMHPLGHITTSSSEAASNDERYVVGDETEILDDGRLAHVLRVWVLE